MTTLEGALDSAENSRYILRKRSVSTEFPGALTTSALDVAARGVSRVLVLVSSHWLIMLSMTSPSPCRQRRRRAWMQAAVSARLVSVADAST